MHTPVSLTAYLLLTGAHADLTCYLLITRTYTGRLQAVRIYYSRAAYYSQVHKPIADAALDDEDATGK